MEVWELKLYFYPSAGGLKKKEKKKTSPVLQVAGSIMRILPALAVFGGVVMGILPVLLVFRSFVLLMQRVLAVLPTVFCAKNIHRCSQEWELDIASSGFCTADTART